MNGEFQAGRTSRGHYVDIENLCREPLPNADLVRSTFEEYETLARRDPRDILWVSCNHKAAKVIAFSIPISENQLLMRSGADGADLRLLEQMRSDIGSGLVSSIVVGSGDGIFARGLADLRTQLKSVTIVSRPEALSAELRAIGRVMEMSSLQDQD